MDEIFVEVVRSVDIVMRKYIQEQIVKTDMQIEEIKAHVGKALINNGCMLLGEAVGMDGDKAIKIAKAATKQFAKDLKG